MSGLHIAKLRERQILYLRLLKPVQWTTNVWDAISIPRDERGIERARRYADMVGGYVDYGCEEEENYEGF